MPAWFVALSVAAALIGAPARAVAQPATFVARTDSNEITLGDVLILEITLSLGEGRADGYMPPTFNGFRILGEYPSQSTQIQMSGGRSVTRNMYTWRYELSPTQSGRLTIAPAKVRAGGRELRTAPIPITVHSGALSPGGGNAAGNPPPNQRQRRPNPQRRMPSLGSPFDDLVGGGDPFGGEAPPERAERARSGGAKNFLRASADKTRAYVGEQVVVDWALYLAERQDKYQAITEARTDGFWSEDLASPGAQGNLSLKEETFEGRSYLVATLQKRALFPLRPGKLTITPLESEVSQVDFFGRVARTERLKAEPLEIEVLPLPDAGRPANFDPAAVGRFSIEVRADRTDVNVGEPVSLTVTISGQGNLRKLAPPRLPQLDGWKLYEPKTDVKIDNQGGITGRKTVEYLLLPERPGTTMVPAFELTYFDPAEAKYQTEKTAPVRLVVKGDASAVAARSPDRDNPGNTGSAGASSGGGVENVIGAELRPPRSNATLRRDLGTSIYRSSGFTWALLVPPLAYAGTSFWSRMRTRFGRDTEGARRRKLKRQVRHHLRAAVAAQQDGNPSKFFAEIDRVLRELLAVRLGQSIAGHSRDELVTLITSSGLSPAMADKIIVALDQCDQARFAPGSVGPAELGVALERAEELVAQIDKPQRRARA
ncbi:MAG TPA: BatD family protein [Polyangia bacterium]